MGNYTGKTSIFEINCEDKKDIIEYGTKFKDKCVAVYEEVAGEYKSLLANTISDLWNQILEEEKMENSFLQGIFIDGKPIEIKYEKTISIKI